MGDPARAQGALPPVPRSFYEDRRELDGDRIRFCVNPEALTYEFDRDVATAIADVLLVSAEFYEIDPLKEAPPLDYRLGLTSDDIFTLLASECDAFVGFKLASAGYPEWMAFTRPYLETDFVLATSRGEYESLADIPTSERIGTRFTSQGDIDFVVFLQARREENRWGRAPYTDNRLLFERLAEGEVDTVLVWETALRVAQRRSLIDEELRIIAARPFEPRPVRFGLVLESRDAYLRTLLDDAIASIVQEGIVADLLEAHGLPGRAPNTRP